MIITPMDQPAIKHLNSYYLHLEKLFEHFRGEIEVGSVHLKSPFSECVIFFDEEKLLNGIYIDKKSTLTGLSAIKHILKDAAQKNYAVSIYHIDHEWIYFFSKMADAKKRYTEDLTTEFADLEGLIHKMKEEKLTGCIDIGFHKSKQEGMLLFHNGNTIGGVCSWQNSGVTSAEQTIEYLLERIKKTEATFNVRTIDENQPQKETTDAIPTATIETSKKTPQKTDQPKVESIPPHIIEMTRQLLVTFENAVRDNKKIKIDFDILLRRKFMEKMVDFSFLDPFSSEFQYTNRKIEFSGLTTVNQFVKAVVVCVGEMADELNIRKKFTKYLKLWTEKYAGEIEKFEITF